MNTTLITTQREICDKESNNEHHSYHSPPNRLQIFGQPPFLMHLHAEDMFLMSCVHLSAGQPLPFSV